MLWYLEHEGSFNGCPNVYTFSSPTRFTSVNILSKYYRERKVKVFFIYLFFLIKRSGLCWVPKHNMTNYVLFWSGKIAPHL